MNPSETRFRIPKSRYASISTYLSSENARYNDINLVKDDELYQELVNNGIDTAMANHMSHLFIRDPLVVFEEKLDIDDEVVVHACFTARNAKRAQGVVFLVDETRGRLAEARVVGAPACRMGPDGAAPESLIAVNVCDR